MCMITPIENNNYYEDIIQQKDYIIKELKEEMFLSKTNDNGIIQKQNEVIQLQEKEIEKLKLMIILLGRKNET